MTTGVLDQEESPYLAGTPVAVTGDRAGTVRMWDLTSRTLIRSLTGHPGDGQVRGEGTQHQAPGEFALGCESAVFGDLGRAAAVRITRPAIAAFGAHALSLSPVAGAGGAIAVQLFASTRTTRRAAAEQRTSATGYLLGLRQELDPVNALGRARRAISAWL